MADSIASKLREIPAWASDNPSGIVEPEAEKILNGWEAGEYPASEYFNWYMNRTDERLSRLEHPWQYDRVESRPNTRNKLIRSGETFGVPPYVAHCGHLRVYINGVLAKQGSDPETATYQEVGDAGYVSDTIIWLNDIPNSFDIVAEAPVSVEAPSGSAE